MSSPKLSVAYLLESSVLCGGVKVVLRQAEALMKLGHRVKVIAPDFFPQWFDGKIDYECRNPFEPGIPDEFDALILTSPDLVLRFYEISVNTSIFHLIQGYEGDYTEAEQHIERIEKAYSLPVTKITISRRISSRLSLIFQGNFVSVGQGLETNIFYPGYYCQNRCQPDKVFLVGANSISIKKLDVGLKAFKLARQKIPGLKLIRVSPVDSRQEEEALVSYISEYHVGLAPRDVAELFRQGNGLLISPSGPGEGFGLPALEAMACGIPVVLTRIPSYLSFAEPADYAYFVEPNNEKEMSTGIISLVRDEAERSRLVRRGVEVAADFSFEKVAENLQSLLHHEIQKHS